MGLYDKIKNKVFPDEKDVLYYSDEKDKTSIAKVQYKNSLGIWTDAYDILTHELQEGETYTSLFGIWCDFPTYTYSVRIYLYSSNATGAVSPGGLRVHNFNFFFVCKII